MYLIESSEKDFQKDRIVNIFLRVSVIPGPGSNQLGGGSATKANLGKSTRSIRDQPLDFTFIYFSFLFNYLLIFLQLCSICF